MTSSKLFNRGYTLIELIVVSSITVILASVAVPALSSAVRSIQGQTVINSLASAYQLARSGAITYRQPVVFCARLDDNNCGDDWRKGALVFVDPDDNRQRSAEERQLAIIPAPPAGSQLVMKAALNKQYLRFMSNGMLENTAGSLVYCPSTGKAREARNLIFTRNGRLRFGADQDHDGILENAEGQPLSCPSG